MRTEANSSDEAGRALAAWLAPFIAEELGLATRPVAPRATLVAAPTSEEIEERFDAETCAEFVTALGDTVLENVRPFFHVLAADGQIGSLQLANNLGVGSPRNIPSVLTTPLKRRAKALGLPNPWLEAADDGDRTVWIGTGSVPERLELAAAAELERRGQ